jgi:hypothetical protein
MAGRNVVLGLLLSLVWALPLVGLAALGDPIVELTSSEIVAKIGHLEELSESLRVMHDQLEINAAELQGLQQRADENLLGNALKI